MPDSPHSTLTLNDGRIMPALGLGTWRMYDSEAAASVCEALKMGYRLIDTAAIYKNESGVGQGLKSSGVSREDVFITTKVWNDQQGQAAAALRTSLDKLRLDYVDLLLIHWPAPRQNRFIEAWRGLVELRASGLARSIGVSNFNTDHLDAIIADSQVVPAVNQIELHPGFQQRPLRDHHARHQIVTQAWSPLGQGTVLLDPKIVAIAQKLGRTPAQIILRSQIQAGLSTIPKSSTPARMKENAALFDFALSAEDQAAVMALDGSNRIGPDPRLFG